MCRCMCLESLNALHAPRNHTPSHSYRHAPTQPYINTPPVTRTECERLEGLKPRGDVGVVLLDSVMVQVQQQGVGAEAIALLHIMPLI